MRGNREGRSWLLRSGSDEDAMGLFTSLSDASFVQRAGGRRLFYPWGSRGRGYEIRSEAEYLRVRREVAWMLRIGIFGLPIAACLGAERYGILPFVLLAPLLSVALLLRMVWLTRGLVPSEERLSAAEARTRLADAVSARSMRVITGFFLALGVVALGFYLAGGGAGLLVLGIATGLSAALLRWGISAFKGRFGQGTS
jgi:hypothetical protein